MRIGRVLSGLIAVGYIAAGWWVAGPQVIYMAAFLLLPLACIWYSEEMGSFTGVMRMQQITATSPGCLVAAVGWLLLLSPIIYGTISYLMSKRP